MRIDNYTPSDGIISLIDQTAKCYYCKGNLTEFGQSRNDILKKMCIELGIDNPTNENLLDLMPTFAKYFGKVSYKYLERGQYGISAEQRSE